MKLIDVSIGSTVVLSDLGTVKVLSNTPLKRPSKGVTHSARVKTAAGKTKTLHYNKRRGVKEAPVKPV